MSKSKSINNKNLSWAEKEFQNVNIGDKRLNKRLTIIAEHFENKPQAQIPQAMGSFSNAKSAYRFFDNKKITFDKIFAPHNSATIERLKGNNIILAIQDTTDLNYSSHPSVANLGPAGNDTNRGFMLHPTIAVSTSNIPLGIIDFNIWVRDENKSKKDYTNLPIEEKESYKWINSYIKSAKLEKKLKDVHFVNISDREGDIYGLFQKAQKTGDETKKPDILIRAAQNRKVTHPQKYLWSYMKTQKVSGKRRVRVPRKKGKPEREAILFIRYAKVEIKSPRYNKKKKLSETIKLWAVYANEENPPKEVEPISWMLLTTMPVKNLEQAMEKIKWYMTRWMIELFFKFLKSGCKVEARQLKNAERLKNCIILDAIIAWRVMFLTYIGREVPDLPASVIFDEYEWKALYSYINKNPRVPTKEPTLGEVIKMVAQLGGFLGRKNDGHPGMMTIWRGLTVLYYVSTTWKIFN